MDRGEQTRDALKCERICLDSGPPPGTKPGGLGTVRFAGRCQGDPTEILERVKSVLKTVNHHSCVWPPDHTWPTLLPVWFTAKCRAEETPEESENWLARWRQLSDADKRKAEEARGYSLRGWLYWMNPDNRQWFWWDAAPLRGGMAVAVAVADWPFPWGALDWLFKAAGADGLTPES